MLPNIKCEAIHQREGAEPGSADFRYSFDPYLNDPAAPLHVEQVYPLAARGPFTVHHDDRLCVGRVRADGSLQLLFDGFAQIPQAVVTDKAEMVSFQALGTPVREWDYPIGGAVYRNADDSDEADDNDVETDLPARFNEDLKANATDEEADSGADPTEYPVFLDWRVCKTRGIGRKWTLGMAVRYLIMRGNPTGEWVGYPGFVSAGVPVLENALAALVPFPEGGTIDWENPGTYDLEPILTPDYDATGKAWPEAVEDLIAPHGFGMMFRLSAKDGEPDWQLEIYRKDRPLRLKALLLQPYGTAVLDPGKSNVGSIKLQRDASQLANEWKADTHPKRYEASFVLAPGFAIDPADAAFPTPPELVDGKDPATFDQVAYRNYVFDEAGEGHWDFDAAAIVDGVGTSLDAVLGKGNYAARRRPGTGTLFSIDPTGSITADGKKQPYKAELWVSTDYAGAVPGVWDRKGTWQKVAKGGWELLKDRLGIHLTIADPNDWDINKDFEADKPFPDGLIQVIRNQCGADPRDRPAFVFRLTCVIEADLDINAIAARRAASPTKYTIRRHDDARDRFRHEIISKSSHLNATGANVQARDDTAKAQAHAEARRRANEKVRFGGSVTIPRFTTAYRIGDRIKAVQGRNIDLRTNIGADQEESAEYPAVVGIDWQMGDQVSTQLHLSDRRAEIGSASRTV